jgi:hypothetical protein
MQVCLRHPVPSQHRCCFGSELYFGSESVLDCWNCGICVNGQLDASISGKNGCWTLVMKQGGSRACLGAKEIAVLSFFSILHG